MQEKLTESWIKISELFTQYIPKIFFGTIILIIGWWIIKRVVKFTQSSIIKKEFDPTIASFSGSALSVTLKLLLIIIVADMVGIKTSSLVAVIGAAGLTIGLALQGSLSNLASGVLILTFKHFKVGDFIESGANSGEVKAIQFFSTTLQTPEEKTVVIPNSLLSNGTIVNLSKTGNLRSKIRIFIDPDTDISNVTKIALDTCEKNENIFKTPKPKCLMEDFDKSAIQFSLYFFTKSELKDVVSSEVRIKLVENFRINNIKLAENPAK